MYIVTTGHQTTAKTVGKKAWILFLLKKYFSVPEFVVISTKAFREYRKYQKITHALEKELKKVLQHFLMKGSFAIRSSGVTEDLPGMSFAGMYTTVLNITNSEDGIAAIIRTWNSVDSKRVKQYCKEMNVSPGDMAVIIQQQLLPDMSGVMITQSPFSVNEMLIECCRGLGEKLVSGKITPTRYHIKDKEIIQQKGTNLLSSGQILKLVKTGKRIENIFKSPQDIEWAIKDGTLYILQSRPVVLHASIPRRNCIVWSNVNVRETIPDPVSPMGWSVFDDTIFSIIMRKVFGFPISHQQYKKFRPIELLSGRLYWNVNNMIAYGQTIGSILDLLEGKKNMDPQLATAFEAVDTRNLPEPLPPLRMFIFSIVAFIKLTHYILLSFFRYGWFSSKIINSYDNCSKIFERLKPSEDLSTGATKVKKWLRLIMTKFARRYFGGVFLSIFYTVFLNRLLRIRLGKVGEAIARKTTFGLIDKTGGMVIVLNGLTHAAKAKIRRITIANLKKLYKTDIEFKKLFDKFICDFGYRGPAEFDIASPNWRENHDMVFKLICTAKKSDKYNINRGAVLKDLLRASRPMERFILKAFIPRLKVFIPLRENGKHVYLKAAARIKDQIFLVEKILRVQGYLKQKRDIFFLTLDDLDGIAEKKYSKVDILNLVKSRKKEWNIYRKSEAPDIVYETGERITASLIPTKILTGESLSYGRIKARVRIIKSFNESSKLREGEILVTHHTDPGWTPLFSVASGVIIEAGGLICHAAMVARELGVPAIVIKGATKLIPDGTTVELDADTGRVEIISNVKDQISNQCQISNSKI